MLIQFELMEKMLILLAVALVYQLPELRQPINSVLVEQNQWFPPSGCCSFICNY